jgi:hypothetical protein
VFFFGGISMIFMHLAASTALNLPLTEQSMPKSHTQSAVTTNASSTDAEFLYFCPGPGRRDNIIIQRKHLNADVRQYPCWSEISSNVGELKSRHETIASVDVRHYKDLKQLSSELKRLLKSPSEKRQDCLDAQRYNPKKRC